MKDPKHYKRILINRMAELGGRLDEIEEHLDEPMDKDFEERATEREDDEVLESLGQAGLAEIAMIKAALERIKHGEFGVCVNCGNDISEERLDAVPHAARCRNCA